MLHIPLGMFGCQEEMFSLVHNASKRELERICNYCAVELTLHSVHMYLKSKLRYAKMTGKRFEYKPLRERISKFLFQ